MNRAIIIATTCVLGLLLTACGDNSAPKPTVVTPEAPVVAAPQADEGTKSEAAAPSTTDAAPAPAQTPAE